MEEDTAKKDSLLTDDPNKNDTTSLTDGVTPELPHAWMSGMTTEQKANGEIIKSVSGFEKGIPELVNSHVASEKKLSQVISIPNGETATEENKAQFHKELLKALGVPEKSEDYTLDKDNLPGDLDEAFEKEYLANAHKNNLTNAQVNAEYQWYIKTMVTQIEAAQKVVKTTQKEVEAELRKELGSDYDAAQAYKVRAFDQFCKDPEISQLFIKTGIGNHPGIIRMFVKMGKLISEHPFNDSKPGAQGEGGKVGERSFEQIADTVYPEKQQ